MSRFDEAVRYLSLRIAQGIVVVFLAGALAGLFLGVLVGIRFLARLAF